MDNEAFDLMGADVGAGTVTLTPLVQYGNADASLRDVRGDMIAVELSPVVVILGLLIVGGLGFAALSKHGY